MKSLLNFIAPSLLILSCSSPINVESDQDASIEEIKSRAKVEELDFEIPSNQLTAELAPKLPLKINPIYRGCILEPGCLGPDTLKIVERFPTFPKPPSDIVDFPDIEAKFPGGAVEFKKFIQENVKYPKEALDQSISGRVYVVFIVEIDGTITNIEVMRNVSPMLDEEAIRIVRLFPKWTPGEVNGQKVRTRNRLPITFNI